jgi:DNA-binding NarL/FixJ family response regulator
MTDAPIRLVLADDHPIVLQGLQQLFERQPDMEVLAACADGSGALAVVRDRRPDVLVLDVRMPGMDGLAVLRELARERLATRVVLLTAALDDRQVLEAVRLGVAGVVLKETAPQALVAAVRKVHAGGQAIEQETLGRVLGQVLDREEAGREAAALLTARELEIVRMVATGLRNKQVADRLFISEGTVKIHLHNIYEKLKVDGRVELALYARDKGLV